MSEGELAAFYQQEAGDRADRALDARRVAARQEFLDLLRREGRRTVIEPGCGPGRDGDGFAAAGLAWTGVDLSQASVNQAVARGRDARQGSLRALPFADSSFDAAWCMSTLLHIPNADLDVALTELARVLTPGAPAAIGLWGAASDEERVLDSDRFEPRRFFSVRSDETVRRRFGQFGPIDDFRTWGDSERDWHYQWFVLRVGTTGRDASAP
ncbi:MAG: class I SAM-dependent methyltransferase [Mycobacteriales bacterium]